MNKIAYGLDIAGYSTGKSGLARACRVGDEIHVSLIREHAFKRKWKSSELYADAVSADVAAVNECLSEGQLIVDVPIDLQGLPTIERPQAIWQLTRRPVDEAFRALPPFAALIGATVVRFMHVLQQLSDDVLGSRLWETYPAGSLKLLSVSNTGYKQQQARFSDGSWLAVSPDVKKQGLAALLNVLDWRGLKDLKLTTMIWTPPCVLSQA